MVCPAANRISSLASNETRNDHECSLVFAAPSVAPWHVSLPPVGQYPVHEKPNDNDPRSRPPCYFVDRTSLPQPIQGRQSSIDLFPPSLPFYHLTRSPRSLSNPLHAPNQRRLWPLPRFQQALLSLRKRSSAARCWRTCGFFVSLSAESGVFFGISRHSSCHCSRSFSRESEAESDGKSIDFVRGR